MLGAVGCVPGNAHGQKYFQQCGLVFQQIDQGSTCLSQQAGVLQHPVSTLQCVAK